MKRIKLGRMLVGAVAFFVSALPLAAHHGSAGYNHQNPVTLTGTVRSIEWVNPHAFIYLDVITDKGAVETWALEGLSPIPLMHLNGWTKDSFKPGTRITVIGFPPAAGYPDGFGTFRSLDQALAYSPRAIDYLHTKHILQVGDIRLSTGEVRHFGMGPLFSQGTR